ncbi:HNH endonuclease [Algibacter sp. 2305UL17-15]|uniref:HNH endonuclease n=1 Tax=Algibacter sp. 2305UL17-15 TaxID=3231268 RepID=UPI0034598F61
MNDDARFKIFNILPAVIITIVICIIAETPVAIVSFLLVYPIWGFLEISISERIRFHNDERKELLKVLKGLNIDKIQWRKFSDLEKKKYRKYYSKLDKLKKEIIRKRYWKKNPKHLYQYEFAEDVIKNEVEKEWEILSLQQRIQLIEKDELEKQQKERKRLDDSKKMSEEINATLIEIEKFEKSPEYIESEKWYESYTKKEAEKKKREKEEFEKRKLEEEEKHKTQIKEEQKRIKEIERKKAIEERKKQEKERYKEYYKRQQREKEKRRNWASEAIEEMIESGEINGNYSSNKKRETIPSHIKEAVWIRDKECCVTCGSKENLEFDHIIPFSKGGSDSINNIQLLCLKCNRSKSNKIM